MRAVIDQALRFPALAESPGGEGELRLELARDLALHWSTAREARDVPAA